MLIVSAFKRLQRESSSAYLFSFSENSGLTLPESDKHLISPFNITPESNIKVMRIKEMIIN